MAVNPAHIPFSASPAGPSGGLDSAIRDELPPKLLDEALGLLSTLGQEFAASLDIENCLKQALSRITAHLEAEAGSLFILEDEGKTLVCRACVGPVDIVGLKLPVSSGIVGASVREGCCQMVRDVRESPDFEGGVDAKTGFVTHSILCAPLKVRNETLGAIELINKKGENKLFTATARRVLETLSASAALAILNARQAARLVEQERMKRELELASEIQRALLPSAQMGGFPVHGINYPARGVSGDFYDFFTIGDGRIGFSLGDVSGKGMNAALLMAKTSSLYRCLGRQGASPGDLLRLLNREICETSMRGMFVTMISGLYDPQSGSLKLASAGHEPPLFHDQKGGFSSLTMEAPPLGIDVETVFDELECDLSGRTMYVFTDGVTESRVAGGGMLGREGLMEAIRLQTHLPLNERISKIAHDLAGGKRDLHDDLTLLAVEAKN